MLEIITPSEVIFKEKIVYARIPGISGYLGILYGHAPLVTAMTVGEIKIQLSGDEFKYFATSGGMLEILKKKVIILAENAEEARSIDLDRAVSAKERAEKRLKQNIPDINLNRARFALVKALNRIKIKNSLYR